MARPQSNRRGKRFPAGEIHKNSVSNLAKIDQGLKQNPSMAPLLSILFVGFVLIQYNFLSPYTFNISSFDKNQLLMSIPALVFVWVVFIVLIVFRAGYAFELVDATKELLEDNLAKYSYLLENAESVLEKQEMDFNSVSRDHDKLRRVLQHEREHTARKQAELDEERRNLGEWITQTLQEMAEMEKKVKEQSCEDKELKKGSVQPQCRPEAQLQSKQNLEIERIRKDNSNRLQKVRCENEKIVLQMRKKYNAELRDLQTKHRKTVEQLKVDSLLLEESHSDLKTVNEQLLVEKVSADNKLKENRVCIEKLQREIREPLQQISVLESHSVIPKQTAKSHQLQEFTYETPEPPVVSYAEIEDTTVRLRKQKKNIYWEYQKRLRLFDCSKLLIRLEFWF